MTFDKNKLTRFLDSVLESGGSISSISSKSRGYTQFHGEEGVGEIVDRCRCERSELIVADADGRRGVVTSTLDDIYSPAGSELERIFTQAREASSV